MSWCISTITSCGISTPPTLWGISMITYQRLTSVPFPQLPGCSARSALSPPACAPLGSEPPPESVWSPPAPPRPPSPPAAACVSGWTLYAVKGSKSSLKAKKSCPLIIFAPTFHYSARKALGKGCFLEKKRKNVGSDPDGCVQGTSHLRHEFKVGIILLTQLLQQSYILLLHVFKCLTCNFHLAE